MALDNEVDPYRLMDQAARFVDGRAERADLLDRAIAAADRSGAVLAQFDTRLERLSNAIFSGEDELAFALFAWCQRTADDRPDIIDGNKMLWRYKWVIAQIPMFARIPQSKITALEGDMANRFAQHGASPRPVFAKRAEVALYQGRVAQARKLWDEAMLHPRDYYADCSACELSFEINLLLIENRFDDVLRAAEPILDGSKRCGVVPHTTLPNIFVAMWAKGQHEEVEKLRAESYRMLQMNADFLEVVALHIELLVASQELSKAAQMLLRHLPWLRSGISDVVQFQTLHAMHCLLQAMLTAPKNKAKWRQQLLDELAQRYGASTAEGEEANQFSLLAKNVEQAGLVLAKALDERNENTYYQMRWGMPAFTVAVVPS